MESAKLKKTRKRKSQLQRIWFRYKKNKLAMFGLIVFITLALIAIFANYIVDYENAINQDNKIKLKGPSIEHPLGTDHYGRDLLTRIVYGARISLFVGFFAVLISLMAGGTIGAVAGYYGGKIDNILMRSMDVLLSLPATVLAITIVAALGGGMRNLLIAMAISRVPQFARIVRSTVLTIKEQEFIEAARACGTRDARIIVKHIIPNSMGPIIVNSTINMAITIIGIAGMSFVGLGIMPPTPEWGSMLADSRTLMTLYPYLIIVPGVAIVLAVLSLNLIGDGIRDALDPRLRN